MAAKRAQSRPGWTAPSAEEMLVIDAQIGEGLDEGRGIRGTPYRTGWGNWEANLSDLIERALGPGSAQAESFNGAGGMFADGPDARDMAASEYATARIEWRDEKIDRFIAAAEAARKAIGQELERRGARPTAVGIRRRDFAFVKSDPVRAIATRDHEELRAVADRTTKATALLAGSVIEAVLFDALGRVGFTAKQLDRMELHEMVDEAAAAKIIQPRTQKAAHAVRGARNFVHPAVELREGRLREVDAKAAIALMNLVLEDLI
jgi:hypothetical protein